jgi:hypothetical protein
MLLFAQLSRFSMPSFADQALRVAQSMMARRYKNPFRTGTEMMSEHPPPGRACLHVRKEDLVLGR